MALVGTPNCGKTALFNALTGSRQKVANDAGVTVERKEGLFVAADGRKLRILDSPGVYSLSPRSPDERVTVEGLGSAPATDALGSHRPRGAAPGVGVGAVGGGAVSGVSGGVRVGRSADGVDRVGHRGILVLEESGYLPRAAFLLDRFMAGVGLSGRSFIPLLSSFACAVPGIMATRTIANPRERLLTILIAPLMTCSARLPVDALLIGAFIPERTVAGLFDLRGLVLLGLYWAGIASAMAVAWLVKLVTERNLPKPLMMELPAYHWPVPRNIAIGLWQRAEIFLRRVGGVILALTVLMWFLASVPAPPPGSTAPAIETSLAGALGRGLAVVLEPIGFNWQISIALVPSMAAREVAISALGTVYALSASQDDVAQALRPLIAGNWSLATGLSLLTWFVFAPQCLSTMAAVRRETGGWKWVGVMALYRFGLAWLACYAVYHMAVALGWG